MSQLDREQEIALQHGWQIDMEDRKQWGEMDRLIYLLVVNVAASERRVQTIARRVAETASQLADTVLDPWHTPNSLGVLQAMGPQLDVEAALLHERREVLQTTIRTATQGQ